MIYEELAINATDTIAEYIDTLENISEIDWEWVKQTILNSIEDILPIDSGSYNG